MKREGEHYVREHRYCHQERLQNWKSLNSCSLKSAGQLDADASENVIVLPTTQLKAQEESGEH